MLLLPRVETSSLLSNLFFPSCLSPHPSPFKQTPGPVNLRGATCFWFWRHFYAGWPHACVQWAALRITWPELPETSASFAHTWWCWSRRCGSQTHPGLDVNSAVRPETQELLFTTLSIVSWIFWMQDKVNTSPSVRYIRKLLFTGEVSFSYNQLCVCARARVLR